MATPTRFPQTCDVLAGDIKTDPFTVVLFGGAGDLARRMILPSLYHLHHDKLLPEDFSITGFGLPAMSDDAYRVFAREALEEFLTGPLNNGQWSIFSRHLFYVSSAFDADSGYKELYRRTGQVCTASSEVKKEVIFYLAVPPPFAPVIIQKLAAHKLCEDTFQPKVVLEKPFGRDRASAADLNRAVLEVFEEQQVYRIDHYLRKETVQNTLFFRFANSIFEPLWNRRYIDQVQITVAEEIGIGHRGLFYDQTGVVRDIVQNHIMQLLALVAMEPPVGFEADFVRDEKVKVFRTVRPMDKQYIQQYTVRGQYGPGKIRGREIKGYREEPHVAPDSITPTFFAARLYIDNWRWAGVPFFIRTGKRLSRRLTEISVHFKQPPLKLLGRACDVLESNCLAFCIQPEEHIVLSMSVKEPGVGNQPHTVHMKFNYETTFGTERHYPYERLLLDCLKGDLILFARQDGVEAMWSVVEPIIGYWDDHPPTDFPNYAAGTWGPPQAQELMERAGLTWRIA